MINNPNIQKAIKVYNAFNKSYYWLDVMIKQGLISESEAGYIVIYS